MTFKIGKESLQIIGKIMEDDEYLCKVETKDGDLYFFTKWFGENYAEFDLILADGRLTWKGKGSTVVGIYS